MSQSNVVNALIEIFLRSQAVRLIFLNSIGAAMTTDFHASPDEYDPKDVECSDYGDQPEVVRIQAELLLLNQSNFSRNELFEEICLQDWR